jgi:hypothetical protein
MALQAARQEVKVITDKGDRRIKVNPSDRFIKICHMSWTLPRGN